MPISLRPFVLSFIACFTVTLASAQGSLPLLEWSPEYSIRDAKFDRILSASKAGFFTYRPATISLLSGARDEYFAYYKRYDLSEEWLLKNPRWEWNGKRVSFSKSLLIEGVQFLFYESFDRQSGTRNLLVRTLDTLANLSEPVLIETLDSRRRSQGDFTIRASRDRTKFAVFTNPPFERKSNENFYVRVYDAQLSELWNADVELSYRDRNFHIGAFDLTNSGEVFMLCVYDYNPNFNAPMGKDLEYKLMRIAGADKSQISEYDLGLRDVAVHTIGLECDLDDNQMAISGFYGRRNFIDMDGALYLSVDQTSGEVLSSNLNAFTSEFVGQFNRYRAKRGKGIRKNFVFRDFVPRPDGGAYIVAEDYEVRVVTTQNGRTTTTNYYYYYNDIIVLSISKEGNVDWYAHVPKRQTSVNDGGYYLGYKFLVNEDGLHFVYNDNRKNAKRWNVKPLKGVTNAKNGNLVMVSLSHDATMDYTVLNRNTRQKFRVSPKFSVEANNGANGAILLSLRGARIRFGNLYFED